ncbi:MAG: hypothetical protein IKC01_08330, partial [Clostridia bacterium]|nr:hypothetical protein [Clostridia bacterium]
VVTNHYSPMTFHLNEFFNKKKAVEHYLKGYREAKKYEDEGFSVLLGMEIRFYATVNDYLVYGVTEEFLENSPFLLSFYLKRAYKLFKKNGFVTVQAHPFRPYIRRANEKYLDGVEIKNGKSPEEENKKALVWADKANLKIRTAGSDCHRESGAGITGIITYEPIKTNEDLLRILRSGNFEIVEE